MRWEVLQGNIKHYGSHKLVQKACYSVDQSKQKPTFLKIDNRVWEQFSWGFYSDSPLTLCGSLCLYKQGKWPEVGGTETPLISPLRLLYKLCSCPLSTRRHSSHPLSPVWSLNDNETGLQESKQFSKLIFLPYNFLCRYSVIHNLSWDSHKLLCGSLWRCGLHTRPC